MDTANVDERATVAPLARIHKLDEVVVNRIAAGEILHRPANAIKEMIENSIDARATSIQITIKDGGMKLLQIQDNGHGIMREDMAIVCERFTTSKLRKFEDLNTIGTFGFRGEALASISHVAHVTIVTKTASSNCAWKASYKDGKMLGDPKPCAGTTGTIITVEDLFYNVTTRRKALTNFSEEYNRILDVVNRYAVHNTGVAFHLKKHGATVADVSTSATSTRLDSIRTLYGTNVARELLPVEYKSPDLQFSANAFISNANYNVKKFSFLLFINHRAVESANLKRAIEAVYATYLPKGTHPFVYISLDILPQHVDVNVHPTKQEVHFLNEDGIVEQVCTCFQEKLVHANTSRTFFTQALLPGASTPASRIGTPLTPGTAAASSSSLGLPATPANSVVPAIASTSGDNLAYQRVRTDNRTRSIEAFVTRQPIEPRPTASNAAPLAEDTVATAHEDSVDRDQDRAPKRPRQDDEQAVPQAPVATARVEVRLSSILELRQTIVDEQHQGILSITRDHFFVGCVNDYLALVQHQTKLYIVNFRELSKDFFYQLALREFNNFGRITLSSPAPIDKLVQLALDQDEAGWTEEDGPKEQLAQAVVKILTKRSEMLAEYFSIEVDTQGQLRSLPLILKGYVPNLDNLPMFLLRLGSEVEWASERECLDGICNQLGWFYRFTPPVSLPHESAEQHQQSKKDYRWHVEHVLFPALRYFYVPSKRLADSGDIVQLADLPDLYKVFERC